MRTHPFGAQDGPIAPNQDFFKSINIILMYLLVPDSLKKIQGYDPGMCSKEFFARKSLT